VQPCAEALADYCAEMALQDILRKWRRICRGRGDPRHEDSHGVETMVRDERASVAAVGQSHITIAGASALYCGDANVGAGLLECVYIMAKVGPGQSLSH
jgi:hypothetical protein